MNKVDKIIAFMFVILGLTFLGCDNEKDVCMISCSGCLQLDIPYISTTECKHYFRNDNLVLSTELVQVVDSRTYGSDCSNFPVGEIELIFETSIDGILSSDTLVTPGCQSPIIPTPGINSLGTISIGDNYEFILLKVYPLSLTLGGGQGIPKQNEYDILGVLNAK